MKNTLDLNGDNIIKLKGFVLDNKILISDSHKIGDFQKVDIVVEKEMLKFLITDRGLLEGTEINDYESVTTLPTEEENRTFNVKDIVQYKSPTSRSAWGFIVDIYTIEDTIDNDNKVGERLYRVMPLDNRSYSDYIKEDQIVRGYSKYYKAKE